MPDPIQLALFYLPCLYLGIIAHEAGHAIAGRLAGFEVTSLGVGLARPFLVVPVGRLRFYLARAQPFQGITFAFMPRPDTGCRRMAAFAAGGLLANAFASACRSLRPPASSPGSWRPSCGCSPPSTPCWWRPA